MTVHTNFNPYLETQPFVRGRIDKDGHRDNSNIAINRDNATLARKLREIKRKPSHTVPIVSVSVTSSPDGPQHASFKHHAEHSPSRGKSPQRQRARQISADNVVLQRKLQSCYAVRKSSFVVQNNLGQGIDCNERWQLRTGVYAGMLGVHASNCTQRTTSRPSTAPASGRHKMCSVDGTGSRPTSAGEGRSSTTNSSSNGVPKTLGVASCSGCGCRSFYQADGVQLKPCSTCRQVYYCSDLCARIDYPSHKALCRYYVTGHWTPAGTRPAADCWIINRSMAVARKLLQQHHNNIHHTATARPSTAPAGRPTNSRCNNTSTQPLDLDADSVDELPTVFEIRPASCHSYTCDDQLDWQQQLEQQLAAVRLQEQQEEMLQQRVEWRAGQGLEGPRPCLCTAGVDTTAKGRNHCEKGRKTAAHGSMTQPQAQQGW